MSRTFQTLGFACYLAVCVGGLGYVAVYDQTPALGGLPAGVDRTVRERAGEAAGVVERGSIAGGVGGESVVSREPWRGGRVVVVIHPKCPCTVASLRVVEGIWAGRAAGGGTALEVVVVVPEGAGAAFAERGAAVEAARGIAGATVVVDAGGVRARELGASASGQVVAYDGEGRLVFSGGVTASRGHPGEADVSVLRDLLAGKRVGRGVTNPVFGCALAGE